MSKISLLELENMKGNVLASHVSEDTNIGIVSASCVNKDKIQLIVDTRATNHMTSSKKLLHKEQVIINDMKLHCLIKK